MTGDNDKCSGSFLSKPRILLVNPPIFDFTAFDFWLRPYGMLRVAGQLRHACDLQLFDYLVSERCDPWGRGRFPDQIVAKPAALRDIPRNFRRFGRPRGEFRHLLETQFDRPGSDDDDVLVSRHFRGTRRRA
jgi:hypothetical protein